jgi:hypothetical protein
MVLVFAFLRLHTPKESFKHKIGRIDWMCVPHLTAIVFNCLILFLLVETSLS